MIVCFDTSALLKLYLEESGSDRIRQVISGADICLAHILTYVEMRAAFAWAGRMQRISEGDLENLVTSFDRDWAAFERMGIDEGLVRQAGQLADRFGLRGYDSVHLAAARRAWEVVAQPGYFAFATFDIRQASAARELGISVLDECPSLRTP